MKMKNYDDYRKRLTNIHVNNNEIVSGQSHFYPGQGFTIKDKTNQIETTACYTAFDKHCDILKGIFETA